MIANGSVETGKSSAAEQSTSRLSAVVGPVGALARRVGANAPWAKSFSQRGTMESVGCDRLLDKFKYF